MRLRSRLSILCRARWEERYGWQTGNNRYFEGICEINIRELTRDGIPAIWEIDRSEVIDGIYYLRDGKLVLEAEHYDLAGWPPGEPAHYTPFLLDCFDRHGHFWGAFIEDQLIGAVIRSLAKVNNLPCPRRRPRRRGRRREHLCKRSILERKFIGGQKDTL